MCQQENKKISLNQAGKFLGFSKTKLHSRLRAGTLPFAYEEFKQGNAQRYRVDIKELERVKEILETKNGFYSIKDLLNKHNKTRIWFEYRREKQLFKELNFIEVSKKLTLIKRTEWDDWITKNAHIL